MNENYRNNFGLTERDMKTIQDILKKYSEINEVHIFGSRARGTHKTGSDVDLAVMSFGIAFNTIARLQSDFEESSLPYNVDLVNFPKLNQPELIDHITRVGIVIYKKVEVDV